MCPDGTVVSANPAVDELLLHRALGGEAEMISGVVIAFVDEQLSTVIVVPPCCRPKVGRVGHFF